MQSMTRKLAAMTAACAVLAACASGPRIYSSERPQTDLSGYTTYSYASPLGTDTPGAPTSLLTQFLRTAVDRELQARGYRYVPEGGQLLVNFFVETQEKLESRVTDRGSPYFGLGYYYYRRGLYASWHTYPDSEISQYTEGTLNIDVADAAQKELLWEGIAIGRVTEEARRNVQAAIDAVVPQIFAQYPIPRRAD